MSKIRRALTFVAALVLWALVMPISAFAATPTTIEVSNSSEFDNAVAGTVKILSQIDLAVSGPVPF